MTLLVRKEGACTSLSESEKMCFFAERTKKIIPLMHDDVNQKRNLERKSKFRLAHPDRSRAKIR